MLNSLIDIGGKNFIPKEDIIAVLDWETLNSSKIGRDFLKENRNNFSYQTSKKAKAYVLTYSGNLEIYESTISSSSIRSKFKKKGMKESNEW